MELERVVSSGQNHRKRRGGSRRKTGCLSCKTRHTRCDERKPVCSNCKRLGLQCQAPEFITHSSWSTAGSTQRPNSSRSPTTVEAASSVPKARRIDSINLYHNESSPPSSLSGSIPSPSSSVQLTTPSPTGLVTLTDEIAYLLKTYQSGLATWMDIFDFEKTYEIDVSRRALDSNLLLQCICAITARHLSHLASGEVWQTIASRYYVEALNRLISEVNCPEPHSDALTAAILLSSYEILAESGTSHRFHYHGAMDLIRVRGISASSTGLDRANFFIYIRHEINIALTNQCQLQFEPQHWNVIKPEYGATEDRMANYLMSLVGMTVNLVYDSQSNIDRQSLINSVEDWYMSTTAIFRGVPYGETNEEGLKKVFFAVPAAAAAMAWYHLTHILLAEQHLDKPNNHQKVQDHATQILSIGISDIVQGARCFCITPIYYAGKHVDDITKKFVSWSLLGDIERELGYHTRARVRSLKQMIGYPDQSNQ